MKDQLDISILNIDKYLTSDKRKDSFLFNPVEIEEKFDGVKISLFHIDNTGDYTKDFILSYKTNIIYPNEFDYVNKSRVRKESINNSQFIYLFDILKRSNYTSLPIGYEFFIEFLMNKPTLSHQYKRLGAVLIAYSKTNYEIKFDRIFSKPQGFETKNREKYAKILGIDYPRPLFKGVLANFERGIESQELKQIFPKYKNTLNIENKDDYISKITEMFLSLDSKYGGKPEGFVLKYPGFLLKIQQSYQTDQNARNLNKDKFRGTPEEESVYWKNVRLAALNIIGSTAIKGNINDLLSKFNKDLKDLKLDFVHPKKTQFQIKDDIQGNIRMILVKRLKGNNNFLFLGKFRVLSKAHYNIIKNGLKNFDNGTICLVSSKETKPYESLRLEMIKRCFPNIEIIQKNSGNIISILQDCKQNINAVLCGTDRKNEYENQLKNNPDIKVIETPRDTNAISATKIIENLSNKLFFERNTPKEIHSLYSDILKVFSANSES